MVNRNRRTVEKLRLSMETSSIVNCSITLFPYCPIAHFSISHFQKKKPGEPGKDTLKSVALFFIHKWIPVISRRYKGFLDSSRADPAQQVQVAAGFIVGTALSRSTKWLLTDHRPGRLIVKIEIACSIFQFISNFYQNAPVLGKNTAG